MRLPPFLLQMRLRLVNLRKILLYLAVHPNPIQIGIAHHWIRNIRSALGEQFPGTAARIGDLGVINGHAGLLQCSQDLAA